MTNYGKPWPLGASLVDGGVNFSVFSPLASKIELLLFKDIHDLNPKVITLDPKHNKSYYYWHIHVPGLEKNQLYAYRAYGPYIPEKGFLFDSTKVLVDPYAKAIVGEYDRGLAHRRGEDNLHSCLKSAVISDEFNWESDYMPIQNLAKSVVYEMHVAGFTRNPNSGVPENIRGTYTGLLEKIPYLKELGVTAVELLPVYAYDSQDAPNDLTNYWGYSPINFFAIHAGYSSKSTPQEIVDEFKYMVKALHRANIEVILDVVYNHTTENNAHNDGPTLCMRGFANDSYYMLDSSGEFRNYTGTGNVINANHSVVRRMIRDSLLYWVQEMRVDGFRFDLASVLSRNESGEPLLNPPILWSIDSDPILANTKIIAEPWDAAGLNQVRDFAGDRWIIWNDAFRDTIRKFVKGDKGEVGNLAKSMLGSPNEIKSRHTEFEPNRSLHFVTCHDGFTMLDLVSYNEKHNWANGEQNRDGSTNNHSWNCGVEGETNDVDIQKLREKQIRNMFSLLMLSHGTPMLLMGDELMRSQQGNNNLYCQDSPLSWMDWDLLERNHEMFDFVSHLIKYTLKHRTFSHPTYFEGVPNEEIPFTKFHGIKQNEPDWSYHSRSLAYEIIAPMYEEHFYIIMNMYHEDLEFQLPAGDWEHVFDTENGFNKFMLKNSIICPARTVICLSSKT
ncbi:glycogen debranching protein GlgX [Weeksellaceae bacterium KMM 9713]|uniref:Glycogen debranching protein GlgX n=1 Tax=Profundicola chukchiensis TaxID=2961959 RepID=A0A9X4MWB9_9FLAO|nr:glycogen debranching protein GlgX [Profundicola chukchiensis]MDG4945273.1 glycogen debranching protein GlgX [Profundicola chukchiensis]